MVAAGSRERSDVAGDERFDLGLRQRRRKCAQERLGILRERLAQPRIVHDPAAQLVHGVDAHEDAAPSRLQLANACPN
jgi:hypothetical protein